MTICLPFSLLISIPAGQSSLRITIYLTFKKQPNWAREWYHYRTGNPAWNSSGFKAKPDLMCYQGATAWMDLATKAQEITFKSDGDEQKKWRQGGSWGRGDHWEISHPLLQSWILKEPPLHVGPCPASHDGLVQGQVPNTSILFFWIFKLWKKSALSTRRWRLRKKPARGEIE